MSKAVDNCCGGGGAKRWEGGPEGNPRLNSTESYLTIFVYGKCCVS